MYSYMQLTKKQARQFMLAHQKIIPARKLQGKEGILEYIRHVGCIQFDPLDVVGYNPYLVLQSRIENFKSEYLQELLYSDRKLLDGWDKNMSIYALEVGHILIDIVKKHTSGMGGNPILSVKYYQK